MAMDAVTDGVDSADQERRSFIQDLLQKQLGRKALSINPLGRDYNNFVYHVKLSLSDRISESQALPAPSPGTTDLSVDVGEVVIRISNPEAMLNEEFRVQNEVAAMSLARQALAGYPQSLVPHVYAWSPSSSGGRGWIVQEYKRGELLDKTFSELDREKQEDLIRQIAQVYKRVQSYPLPDSVQGCGGLQFNSAGEIITGPTTIPCGGPFGSLEEMYSQMFRRQLDESDTSTLVQGWRTDGLRDRLERFASGGIAEVVKANSISRRALIHADFDLYNMLYDPASNQLTALLDFDFSHIASPAEEYFYSLKTIGALLAGPFEEGEEGRLRKCLLEGFDGNMGTGTLVERWAWGRVTWEVALLTDHEFRRAGVLRPADIPGCGELAALKWFLEDVSPPYFYMPRWLEGQTQEKLNEIRNEIWGNLDRYLLRWGY